MTHTLISGWQAEVVASAIAMNIWVIALLLWATYFVVSGLRAPSYRQDQAARAARRAARRAEQQAKAANAGLSV